MDKNSIKCSFKDHHEIEASIYCQECKVYLCNKCNNFHSKLCENHHIYKIDKNLNELFTGFCKEEKHSMELNYFCKAHNQLCCAACIAKIKNKGDGQHKDCDVCTIEEIKNEKQNNLKENIKLLENLSNNLEQLINDLKNIFIKMNENKDELKAEIQKIFTNIRNELNLREDKLLLEVDEEFNKLNFKEDIIKQSENLPNKIKLSLEKGKNLEKLNDDGLIFMINDCINIENNIKDINLINENINKCNKNSKKKIEFYPKEKEINNFLETIKIFGRVCYLQFSFKKCPNNVNENRKYTITGDFDNIITKTGSNNWMGTICEDILDITKIYKWKVKILKTQYYHIMVGVAPIDFNINSSSYNTCGWYYDIRNYLYSGPPYNYSRSANLNSTKDEVTVIINMKKRTLKFIINNEDKGDSYTNIPIDKQISPAILLCHQNDSVEITDCSILE